MRRLLVYWKIITPRPESVLTQNYFPQDGVARAPPGAVHVLGPQEAGIRRRIQVGADTITNSWRRFFVGGGT